jgi:hypothetical protein
MLRTAMPYFMAACLLSPGLFELLSAPAIPSFCR